MGRKLVTGESVSIESTYPGVYIEHLPGNEYAVVVCVLPNKMFDADGDDQSNMVSKDWAEMVAYLWKAMGVGPNVQ